MSVDLYTMLVSSASDLGNPQKRQTFFNKSSRSAPKKLIETKKTTLKALFKSPRDVKHKLIRPFALARFVFW